MDRVVAKEKVGGVLRRYKYALLILAVGLFLMCLPSGSDNQDEAIPETVEPDTQVDIATQLEQILSQIDGAGKVQVMLSPATGEETYYQTDDDRGTDSDRSDTVIITDADRAQQGLVRKIDPPTYLGAIVVCQGADRATVRLAIVEAVSHVTGLGTDRISVLKMK